jgi:hypothetical protein
MKKFPSIQGPGGMYTFYTTEIVYITISAHYNSLCKNGRFDNKEPLRMPFTINRKKKVLLSGDLYSYAVTISSNK